MSRAGRKRKNVTRKAGRVDWRAMAEDPSLLTKWTAARDRYLEMGANPRMASQAGQLYALRHLTAVQVEAARNPVTQAKVLVERGAYVVVPGPILRNYKTGQLKIQTASEQGVGSLERFVRGGGRESSPDEVERFLARFQPVQNAVLQAGKPALSALNRLCRDEAASSVLDEARKGLTQLVAHFRLEQHKGH